MVKILISRTKLGYLFILFLLLQPNIQAQNTQREILDKLLEFHSTPKEIAYLHLNKSLLLQGEQLAFSAYVITQKEFKPSKETTNLYVQIKDSTNAVIKEKLVLIDKGTGATSFDIDSTFSTGSYSITAYTNWMRNFDQQYYFTETIQVIKSNLDRTIKTVKNIQNIDAQFLPESGHLLENVQNNLGIVIKDSLGYGIPNAYVRILNQDNQSIENLRLNQFGIGKISFIPKSNEHYKAFINFQDQEFIKNISNKVEKEGVILSTDMKDQEIDITLKTNRNSLEKFGKEPFILSIQNTTGAITYEVTFNDELTINIPVAFKDLKPGMNIVTLFDNSKNPVAERLFFNYNDLKISRLETPVITKLTDTLHFELPTRKLADSTFLSISLLPENTVSDKRHHNIISYFMLQPHIKGHIENASWYFSDINESKKKALDDLLLTQGWSSYDWKSTFDKPVKLTHQFEKYQELKATANEENNDRFLVHASSTNPPTFVDIPKEQNAFIIENVIPMEGENLFISRIKKNGGLMPAGLAVQFFPNSIGSFQTTHQGLKQRSHLFTDKPDGNFSYFNDFSKGTEQLEEVLIETKMDRDIGRERKIGMHAWGKVHVMNDEDKMMFNTLANYLISQGLRVSESPNQFNVMGGLTRPAGFGNTPNNISDPTFAGNRNNSGLAESQGMVIFLDGMPLYDKAILYQYPLANIDYIEINRTGLGSGFLGANGSIKIFSNFDISFKRSYRTRIQEFEFPVSYALNKEFYIPRYSNNTDTFFQEFGVIDWKNNLTAGKNQNIEFDIARPKVDYKLIIEGFTASGKLIYEVQSISIN